MRNRTFAFVTISLVVVSALTGYLVGLTASHGTIATAYSSSPCLSPVSPSNATGMIEVYQMTPESVGETCVNYRFNGAGVYSFVHPDYGPWTSSGFCACGCPPTWANGTQGSLCSNLSITSSEGEFVHFASQNVTVEYTLRAGKNSTGVFWLFIASCRPITIVVGALPASVPSPILECEIAGANSPSSDAVTGVSNVHVAFVPAGP
jgi:hypothetical protein